jgi:hypothetical protein
MVGQQPNVPVGIEDLPRYTGHPGAPGRWKPDRPGDLTVPGDVPTGGSFGTPGPDTGYALRILRGRPLPGSEHLRSDVVAAVAAVMAARAAALGRAPVPADVEAALALLTLDESALGRMSGIGHDHARLRGLVAAIPAGRLTLPPARLRG